MTYGFLLKPNANLPYFEEMKRMAESELRLMFDKLKITIQGISTVSYGRGVFLMVDCDELIESHYKHLSRLSFFYIIFEVKGEAWIPLPVAMPDSFSEDLSIRLKYNGKTNEAFTRLLMNTALYSTGYHNVDNIILLDPVCGKGTTLFEGMIQGYTVWGADINKKSFEDMRTYFLRYLKEGRYKHDATTSKAMVGNKAIGELFEVKACPDKKTFKGMKLPNYKVFRGDTTRSHDVFKNNSVHIICGDLPYGVQHKGKADQETTRNLNKWLEESMASWTQLLKKNGAIALSWNTYTNKREDLTRIMEEAGLTVSTDEGLMKFHHRVSQAINRDIIVGIKK